MREAGAQAKGAEPILIAPAGCLGHLFLISMPDGIVHCDRAAELLARLADDDPDALSDLYVQFSALVRRRLARCGCRCTATLDDLTQEVFLTVWRRRKQYLANGSGSGYLCGVAKFVVRDHRRRQRHYQNALSAAEPFLRELTSRRDDPVERLDHQEQREQLRKVIGELPEPQQQAIKVVLDEPNSSIPAVAADIGCSPDAFRMRLGRAVARLSDLL